MISQVSLGIAILLSIAWPPNIPLLFMLRDVLSNPRLCWSLAIAVSSNIFFVTFVYSIVGVFVMPFEAHQLLTQAAILHIAVLYISWLCVGLQYVLHVYKTRHNSTDDQVLPIEAVESAASFVPEMPVMGIAVAAVAATAAGSDAVPIPQSDAPSVPEAHPPALHQLNSIPISIEEVHILDAWRRYIGADERIRHEQPHHHPRRPIDDQIEMVRNYAHGTRRTHII